MGTIRRTVTALAVATTGAAAATLWARGTPVRGLTGLTMAVVSPYAAALSTVGIAAALRCRSRVLAVTAVVVATVSVGTQVLWHYRPSASDPGAHTVLRVLASNIRTGDADAPSFAALAERSADVVVVVELTPEARQRFSGAGLDAVFPHTLLIPAPGSGGIGIWSRFPLAPLPVPAHPAVTAPAALLKVPGAALDTVLVAVHVKSPLADGQNTVGDWSTGISHLRSQLDRFAMTAGAGAVVVAGDFNATADVRQFRDLLTGGYRDSVEQLGAGFAPTFPSDRWFPPLFTIDHVLTRNAPAMSMRVVDVAGADHRGLLVDVAVQ